MNEGLVFKIGADIGDLEKGISESQKQLQQFGQTIKASTSEPLKTATSNLNTFDNAVVKTATDIKTVQKPVEDTATSLGKLKIEADDVPGSIGAIEKEINNLGKTLKTSTGTALADTNKKIAELKTQLVNLKKSGLDQLPKGAADGAVALNSLGQVARDLPFGFIAIQNNIPAVFDSFSQLSKKTNGAIPALKSLGQALIGPAGIAFAAGLVISGITELVQTYGSFGAAIDAIFTKQSKFSEQIRQLGKEYQDYNKERRASADIVSQEVATTESQIQRVKTLSAIINDSNKSYNERNSALNSLKSISKDFFGTLDLETLKFIDLSTAVNAYANSLKQAAITKGFEQAIGETSVQLSKQKGLLNQLGAELEYVKNQKIIVGKADLEVVDKTAVDAAQKRFDNQNKIVKALERNFNAYKANLDASVNAENRIKAPVDAANEAFKAQQDALKEASKATKDFYYELQTVSGFISKDEKLTYQQRLTNLQNYANIILNVKASEQDRRRALEQASKENNNFFDTFKIGVTSLEVFKNALNSQAAVLQENIINQETYNNSVKALIPTFDVLAMRQDERNKQLKEQKALLTDFKTPTITAPQGLPANLLSDDITKRTKEQQDEINKSISNYQAAYNIINDSFFSPLQDLFSTFLSTGKLAFADFGKAILKAIQQIVAKIIATGIITLLANIFLPGIGAAGAAGGKAAGGLGSSLLSGIGAALGFNLGGSVSAPQFAGVGGGTMGMSGSVNVVLRGSDLVGSINRTNATISRVG